MAGPTTDIEIMANAAVLLGKKAFATIEDSDEFAVSLQKFYDMLVPSELSKNHWKFCKKYVELSQSSSTPDFAEYSTAYDLPADFLSAVRVFPNVHYQIFGKQIYTGGTGTLKLEYNYQVPVTFWSPAFKEFIVYSLASQVAAAVTEDARMVQMMQQERHRVYAQAMWVDSQNAPNVSIQHRPWIEARQFGGTGPYNNTRN